MQGREDAVTRAATTTVRRAPWQAVALEVTASVLAFGAVVMFPLHYIAARLAFLGDQAVVHEEEVRFYWTLVGVLAVAVLASLAGALWRKGRKTFAWHGLVATLGVVVVVAFPVTATGTVAELDRGDPATPEDRDRPANSVCHSGGDSDECLGG